MKGYRINQWGLLIGFVVIIVGLATSNIVSVAFAAFGCGYCLCYIIRWPSVTDIERL